MEHSVVWFFLWLIIGILLCDLILRVISCRIILKFFRKIPSFEIPATSADLFAEEVTFPTTDGLTLRGNWYRHTDKPARGVIVFCHEFLGNRWLAMSYCEGLWNAGYDVFTFDYRNHGDSDAMPNYQPIHWLTEYEVQDTQAAIRFLQSQIDTQQLPIGIFGVSRGGTAALATAARVPEIQHIVADGAFSIHTLAVRYVYQWGRLYFPDWIMASVPKWHIHLTLTMARLISQWQYHCRYIVLERSMASLNGRHYLFIAGQNDSYVPPSISEELAGYLRSPFCDIWLAPNAKHNCARRENPAAYDQQLLEFFSSMQTHLTYQNDEQMQKITSITG